MAANNVGFNLNCEVFSKQLARIFALAANCFGALFSASFKRREFSVVASADALGRYFLGSRTVFSCASYCVSIASQFCPGCP